MCIDFQVVNKITVMCRDPIPRLNDMLNKLHGACIFINLSLRVGITKL